MIHQEALEETPRGQVKEDKGEEEIRGGFIERRVNPSTQDEPNGQQWTDTLKTQIVIFMM